VSHGKTSGTKQKCPRRRRGLKVLQKFSSLGGLQKKTRKKVLKIEDTRSQRIRDVTEASAYDNRSSPKDTPRYIKIPRLLKDHEEVGKYRGSQSDDYNQHTEKTGVSSQTTRKTESGSKQSRWRFCGTKIRKNESNYLKG